MALSRNLRLSIGIALLGFFVLGSRAQGQGTKEFEFPSDWYWHQDDEQRAKHAELLGKPMPPLDLTNWKNGELTMNDLRGKVVVLDFWATWCGPCIASIPHNNEMAEKYREGVVVLGICTNKRGQEKYEQVVNEKGIKYPSARDPDLKAQTAYRVMWYPTYAVVDKAGKLRAIGLKPDKVEGVVEKLIAETPSASAEPAPDERRASNSKSPKEAAQAIDPSWLNGSPEERARFTKIEGKPAPALTVTNWINAEKMTVKKLKGKVLVIDFWATWCGPCMKSIPFTNELMDKYGSQGMVVLGVCHTEGAENMAQVVKEKGIRYPVAADTNMRTNKTFLVTSYPSYYLVDRSGKLRIAACKGSKLEEAIQALLAEPEPTASR